MNWDRFLYGSKVTNRQKHGGDRKSTVLSVVRARGKEGSRRTKLGEKRVRGGGEKKRKKEKSRDD